RQVPRNPRISIRGGVSKTRPPQAPGFSPGDKGFRTADNTIGASVPVRFFWRHGWAQEGDRQVRPIPSPLGDAPADVVEAGASTRGQILLPGLHADGPIHLEFRVQAAAAVAPFGNLVLSVTLPGGSN